LYEEIGFFSSSNHNGTFFKPLVTHLGDASAPESEQNISVP
jgi:hypothetical protein